MHPEQKTKLLQNIPEEFENLESTLEIDGKVYVNVNWHSLCDTSKVLLMQKLLHQPTPRRGIPLGSAFRLLRMSLAERVDWFALQDAIGGKYGVREFHIDNKSLKPDVIDENEKEEVKIPLDELEYEYLWRFLQKRVGEKGHVQLYADLERSLDRYYDGLDMEQEKEEEGWNGVVVERVGQGGWGWVGIGRALRWEALVGEGREGDVNVNKRKRDGVDAGGDEDEDGEGHEDEDGGASISRFREGLSEDKEVLSGSDLWLSDRWLNESVGFTDGQMSHP